MSFDLVAPRYFELWTDAKSGRLQREAVWRHTSHLLHEGTRILDLGCGTGDDAVYFADCGAKFTGIDSSSEMVRIARERGVDARVGTIEGGIAGAYDILWSNFGALNCIENLSALRDPLAKTIRPSGHFVACVMSRVCLWETLWYLSQGNPSKATRRWKGEATSSLVSRVFYPTASTIARALAPDFRLVARHGIGVAVPPSCVSGIADSTMETLASFDRNFASLPVLRALGDHQLLIFRKSRNEAE